MKLKVIKTIVLTFGMLLTALVASETTEGDHAKAGPSGGRLLTKVTPHAEFFVNAERKVEIRFLEKGTVVPPKEQVVMVIMGDRAAPTRLNFIREGDKLVSDKAIPEGNRLPTIVQIKMSATDKTMNERFYLDLTACPTCEHAEYACTCSHGDEHDHKAEDKQKQATASTVRSRIA